VPDPSAAGLTDVALLTRSAAGDRDAFDEVVRRHHASVFRLARLLVNKADGAEDVLQQTFLSAWRGAGGFRAQASARTWLLTIAKNAAWRMREREAREPLADTPLDELGIQAGWGGPDPEALAIAAEQRDRLHEAFADLTPEEREVLTLRDLEGLTGEETAALLGVTVPAMKSRLHRARMRLAARLTTEVSRATGRA
jgi:RNA polymerase sigma-70 factor, ECF subfamily